MLLNWNRLKNITQKLSPTSYLCLLGVDTLFEKNVELLRSKYINLALVLTYPKTTGCISSKKLLPHSKTTNLLPFNLSVFKIKAIFQLYVNDPNSIHITVNIIFKYYSFNYYNFNYSVNYYYYFIHYDFKFTLCCPTAKNT